MSDKTRHSLGLSSQLRRDRPHSLQSRLTRPSRPCEEQPSNDELHITTPWGMVARRHETRPSSLWCRLQCRAVSVTKVRKREDLTYVSTERSTTPKDPSIAGIPLPAKVPDTRPSRRQLSTSYLGSALGM